MSQARALYEAFIAAIDNTVALTGCGSTLAECVDDSARTNANDTMIERGCDTHAVHCDEYWAVALDTAKFMLDDWCNNYPELRREI